MSSTRSSTTTIDAAGRLVIPKAARDHLHLHGGDTIIIDMCGDHLEIRPQPANVTLVGRGDRFVISADDPVLVTDSHVRDALEAVRQRR